MILILFSKYKPVGGVKTSRTGALACVLTLARERAKMVRLTVQL